MGNEILFECMNAVQTVFTDSRVKMRFAKFSMRVLCLNYVIM